MGQLIMLYSFCLNIQVDLENLMLNLEINEWYHYELSR